MHTRKRSHISCYGVQRFSYQVLQNIIDIVWNMKISMGLLPDAYNCGMRMRQECRERFPRHRLQLKPLVSDPGTHHGTCVAHVPWYMSGLLTRGGGGSVPGIPGACATHNFTYLARGPYSNTAKTQASPTNYGGIYLNEGVLICIHGLRISFSSSFVIFQGFVPLETREGWLPFQRCYIKHIRVTTRILQQCN